MNFDLEREREKSTILEENKFLNYEKNENKILLNELFQYFEYLDSRLIRISSALLNQASSYTSFESASKQHK